MVEEASTLFDENDAELLCSFKDGLVVLATAWSGNVFGTRAGSTEYVVDKGELL